MDVINIGNDHRKFSRQGKLTHVNAHRNTMAHFNSMASLFLDLYFS